MPFLEDSKWFALREIGIYCEAFVEKGAAVSKDA